MSAESVRKALAAAVEAIGGSQRAGQIAMAEAVANALAVSYTHLTLPTKA